LVEVEKHENDLNNTHIPQEEGRKGCTWDNPRVIGWLMRLRMECVRGPISLIAK
jgi:hypothetical protein